MNIRWSTAGLAALLLVSCDVQDSKPLADRGTNDETSSFYLQDGQKASNATVTVFAAGGTDTLPTTRSYTNSEGQVKLSALPKGYYSLLVTDRSGRAAFVDSVYSDGVDMNLPSDTLRPTGSIKGRIKVQTQDDPKIAWVALVGEGHFQTIDDDSGFFTLAGVPAGQHTLVAKTDRGDYTSTFRTATVVSDSTTDIGTLEIVYTGLPIVTGIVGTWDSLGGAVALRWDASTSPKVKGYYVYRSTGPGLGTLGPLGSADSGTTSFVDTLFPASGRLDPVLGDSGVVHYRVVAVGQNGLSGDPWYTWSSAVRRPYLVARLPAAWSLVAKDLPTFLQRLDTLPGHLIALGWDGSGGNVVWKSPDGGKNWTMLRKELDTSRYQFGNLGDPVVHQGRLHWVKPIASGRKSQLPSFLSMANMTQPDLADSLRWYRMDASGRIDSTSIATYDDSINAARLVLDSAGLVLVQGPIRFHAGTWMPYFSPVHRFLETESGTWLKGDWAPWYQNTLDPSMWNFLPTFRTISVGGKVTIHPGNRGQAKLDLDSLMLSASSDLSYTRPGAPDDRHLVQGASVDMGLSSIAWFDRKIYVLGNGALWNVSLP